MSLSSGYAISANNLRSIAYFLFGASGVLLSRLLLHVILLVEKKLDSHLLYGIFCGAMTSTPGLAALCEDMGVNASLATSGYSGAYLIGVIFVVLFVQIVSQKAAANSRSNLSETQAHIQYDSTKPMLYGIIQLSVVISLGCLLGKLNLPVLHFSLGNTGGIMCVGLVFGALIESKFAYRKIPKNTLDITRTIGLMFFFVGSGIPAGASLLSAISIKMVVYALALSLFPILISFWAMLVLSRRNIGKALSAVCGVMTSTPAMGVLLRQSKVDPDMHIYSMSYTGALLTITLLMSIF
jgi:putative transport protein